jgi:hypothetical protein
VAADAAVVLHLIEPFGLRHVGADAGRVAVELIGPRDLQHRVPIDGRVVLRSLRGSPRWNRRDVYLSSRRRRRLVAVDETVAAGPDLVIRGGKIRDDVAPLIVGDDDLDVANLKVARFRDDPDARLGSIRPRDDAADVVGIDRHSLPVLLGLGDHQRARENHRERGRPDEHFAAFHGGQNRKS